MSSEHKLQKFTSSGELIKCVGKSGNREKFSNPRGVTLYNNEVYVCDSNNHRIQVFDLDLNFVRSIGSYGKEKEQLYSPGDIKFDGAGNMHITEYGNKRVQVLDSSGHFIRQEGKGRLIGPGSAVIADQFLYVSDIDQNRIIVMCASSGNFVTSFGQELQLSRPFFITSCADGCIYVSDYDNNRIQIF